VQIYGQYCPVARAAELLADRWTVLIVRELLADILISMTSSAAFLGFRARF
jgi:DNA-binding HxlR family transcriptional regulator